MEESIASSPLSEIIASLKEALLQQSFEAGKLLIELERESVARCGIRRLVGYVDSIGRMVVIAYRIIP
jgi:hypothetical protein